MDLMLTHGNHVEFRAHRCQLVVTKAEAGVGEEPTSWQYPDQAI